MVSYGMGARLLAVAGMTGSAPCSTMAVRTALLSYPRSAISLVKRPAAASIRALAMVTSLMLPAEIRRMRGRPLSSVRPWSLLVRPPREVPMACAKAPLLRRLPSDAP